ncbi:hypothetical protein SAMN06273572_101828 [Monaibacterium marinum]|uniref:Uncharacterized protein n=1 Tax=Pontivivens marinum TaxID=1690039 RepID=A0A2C9CNS8_9RHOB|nr:hypothetical protein [Monaibacterium marinum]SOH92974.1 hypothetical protein SAMN06273572_101828 [Monaibacterium marinum]
MIRAILVCLMVQGAAAQATPFEDALTQWLGGHDLPALQLIADAAAAGDVDARLFLGTVEHMGELHGDGGVAALDRAQRIALFRAPVGLSGTSWLDGLQGALPELIRDLDSVRTAPETVLGLDAMGETRLAREALRAQAKREYFDLVAASLTGVPHMAAVVAGRAPNAPDLPDVSAMNLSTNPDAVLPRAVCGADCGAQCLQQIVVAIGGHAGLMQLGSPITTLIPEDIWNDSTRAMMSVEGLARLRGQSLPACAN